jgi:hypothetical protein
VDKLREELSINNTLASAESPTPLMTADTLSKLENLRIEAKAQYISSKALLDHLKAIAKDLGPEGLARAIPRSAPDLLLDSLLDQLTNAEQRLVALERDYGEKSAEVIKDKALVDDLHNKIKSRVDGIMLGLETRVLSLSNSLDNLDKEVAKAITNDVERANQTRPNFEAKRNLDERQRFRQISDMKVTYEKVEAELPKLVMVDIVDLAVPPLHPISPNLRGGLVLITLGVLLDITGLLTLRGRPSAASEPSPA